MRSRSASRQILSLCSLAIGAALLAWGCSSTEAGPSPQDDGEDSSAGDARSSSGTSGTSSSGDASSNSPNPGDAGGEDLDATAADAGPDDAALLEDASSADGGVGSNDLPGLVCTGALTDSGLVALYSQKPMTGTPSYVIRGSAQARRLGTYTGAVYMRPCDSAAGCGAWSEAEQPAYEYFESINSAIRAGTLYLWSYGQGQNRFGIVSTTVGDECLGWTEGIGEVQRDGTIGNLTLDTKVRDNCNSGADPVFYFNEADLYDPVGIVTDHCMKLSYSKQINRIDIGPGAFLYEEYVVVYDATF